MSLFSFTSGAAAAVRRWGVLSSLCSPHNILFVDENVAIERGEAGWNVTWSIRDVNCIWNESMVMTSENLVETGPPVRMTADELDSLARRLEREPSSLSWCVERRLVERIVEDDLEGVLVQLDTMCAGERPPATTGPIFATTSDGRVPILTIALGVAAWVVAAELVLRGEPLTAPPHTVWDAASYAIAALDDSAGATVVLQHLIQRGRIPPSAGLLRHARSPRIMHALIDAGVHPDAHAPAEVLGNSTLGPELFDATPLTIAVVRNQFDVAAALFERGASLEARDARGRTALIVAVLYGNEAPVRWLIVHGADLDCSADVHGRTPRSLALARPDDPGSRLLLAALAEQDRRRV